MGHKLGGVCAILAVVACGGEPKDSVDAQLADAGPDAELDACVAVAETCNASDDDCNGIVDDGTAATCYPLGVPGCDPITGVCMGICALGTSTCEGGVLGACTGATVPRTDICCNTMDDDCDGLVDGADSDCTNRGTESLAARVGNTGSDTARAGAALPDGGGIIAGDTNGDAVVLRYAANGTITWARGFTGTGYSYAQAVTALADGTSFVTGNFGGSVTFAPSTTRVAVGSEDLFVARFDGAGTLVWLRTIGSTSTDEALATVLMSDGSILVGGAVGGNATFGAGEATATTLPAGGYLARFAADGSLVSARSIGSVRIRGLARRTDDSIVAAGSFSGTVTLGTGEPAATTLTSAGTIDAFVASYSPSGALGWARSQGGPGNDETFTVDTLAGGDVVIAGSSTQSAVFGANEAAATTIVSAGGSDAFLARLGATGNLVWARSGGSGRDDVAYGVAAAPDGGIVLVGRYGSLTATFGADGSGCPTTLSAGASGVLSTDIFVLKYDATGALLWGKKGGGGAVDTAWGVDITPSGGAMVVGDFGGQATFGTFMLTQGDSLGDAFVVHYEP